jgi:hypothetical protein
MPRPAKIWKRASDNYWLFAYAFRHTYISDALAKGLSVAGVAEFVGKSLQTIASFSCHIGQSHDAPRHPGPEVGRTGRPSQYSHTQHPPLESPHGKGGAVYNQAAAEVDGAFARLNEVWPQPDFLPKQRRHGTLKGSG